MDMGWDYQYYQPWSDNKWLLQELTNDNVTMEKGEEESYLFRLNKDKDIRLLDNSQIILRQRLRHN